MRLKRDQCGFVLSGTGLLLVLPAMVLMASFLAIVEIGGGGTSLQGIAEKVFYTGNDIERVLADVWDENLLSDNEPNANATFAELADNYRASTGLLLDVTPSWMLWVHVQNTGENHYAGTEYCRVERLSAEDWRYRFEDWNDWDYDEPVLLVTKLKGQLRITLEEYGGGYLSDIYYSDNLLWENVTGGSPSIGESVVVDGTVQLVVPIYVSDSRGAVWYSSTVSLG
jgi:hypothetical protein